MTEATAAPPPPPPGPREIFPFYEDGQLRYADPHRVRRLLHACLGANMGEVIGVANAKESPPAAWSAAREQLYRATLAAFDMKPFDRVTGKGAQEEECRELLSRFFIWEDDLKKKRGSTPTSPRATTRASSPSRTRGSTGCGST